MCGSKSRTVLYYIESDVAYGDFDMVGGCMIGKPGLIKLKEAIQTAIRVIKNENT